MQTFPKACVYDDSVRVSNVGYYKNDCFLIISKISELNDPKDGFNKFKKEKNSNFWDELWSGDFSKNGKSYAYVESQSADGEKLNVVRGRTRWFGLNCVPDGYGIDSESVQVPAASVVNHSLRRGIVYGALIMPYKYYRDGTFKAAASIGPYVGRRTEFFGGAMVVAATIGASSVGGEISSGTGTQTVPLTAVTAAIGTIFEVGNPGNPFRMGMFFGQDRVKKLDPGVTYDKNGKTWMAIQFGYDFTDK